MWSQLFRSGHQLGLLITNDTKNDKDDFYLSDTNFKKWALGVMSQNCSDRDKWHVIHWGFFEKTLLKVEEIEKNEDSYRRAGSKLLKEDAAKKINNLLRLLGDSVKTEMPILEHKLSRLVPVHPLPQKTSFSLLVALLQPTEVLWELSFLYNPAEFLLSVKHTMHYFGILDNPNPPSNTDRVRHIVKALFPTVMRLEVKAQAMQIEGDIPTGKWEQQLKMCNHLCKHINWQYRTSNSVEFFVPDIASLNELTEKEYITILSHFYDHVPLDSAGSPVNRLDAMFFAILDPLKVFKLLNNKGSKSPTSQTYDKLAESAFTSDGKVYSRRVLTKKIAFLLVPLYDPESELVSARVDRKEVSFKYTGRNKRSPLFEKRVVDNILKFFQWKKDGPFNKLAEKLRAQQTLLQKEVDTITPTESSEHTLRPNYHVEHRVSMENAVIKLIKDSRSNPNCYHIHQWTDAV